MASRSNRCYCFQSVLNEGLIYSGRRRTLRANESNTMQGDVQAITKDVKKLQAAVEKLQARIDRPAPIIDILDARIAQRLEELESRMKELERAHAKEL
jgi:uncharacterized protein (DUF3084 family)